jgi:hypothetical protein
MSRSFVIQLVHTRYKDTSRIQDTIGGRKPVHFHREKPPAPPKSCWRSWWDPITCPDFVAMSGGFHQCPCLLRHPYLVNLASFVFHLRLRRPLCLRVKWAMFFVAAQFKIKGGHSYSMVSQQEHVPLLWCGFRHIKKWGEGQNPQSSH